MVNFYTRLKEPPNMDMETGIHYGVISYNSIMPEALDDVYQRGENLTYAVAREEVRRTLRNAVEECLPGTRRLNQIFEEVWDAIEQDWSDGYEDDNDTYRLEEDGYILETSSLGLYVIKSPYWTETRLCSPCAPNAGDLDSPEEGGVKTYCLGADWFDGEAPYPIKEV